MSQHIYTLHHLAIHPENACNARPSRGLPEQQQVAQQPIDHELRRQIDAETRRVIERLACELGVEIPPESVRSNRQNLIELANRYQGPEAEKFADYCRGLHLMAQYHFRAALAAFERVMLGSVAPEFETIREMALQSHSFCLEQLGFDDLSMERFLGFLYQKFDETRHSGQADGVARLLGLGGRENPMTY